VLLIENAISFSQNVLMQNALQFIGSAVFLLKLVKKSLLFAPKKRSV